MKRTLCLGMIIPWILLGCRPPERPPTPPFAPANVELRLLEKGLLFSSSKQHLTSNGSCGPAPNPYTEG
jgi:hypothetical protein